VTPATFVALAATVALTALTPGPAVAAIVARAIDRGARPALCLSAGVLAGDLLFLALAAAGMAAVAQSSGEIFVVLRWAGAAYLAWQGLSLWLSAPPEVGSATPPLAGQARSLWGDFAAGLLLMLGHVQAMLFYAALLPGFVDFGSLGLADFLLVALLIVVIIGGVNAGYALLASRARRFFADARAQRALRRTSGTLMLVAAVLVVTRV
jgi:threonine/homoserine/homoserine lactone efflux protein